MEVLGCCPAGSRMVTPTGDSARHVGRERKVGAFKCDVVAVVQPRMIGIFLGHRAHLVGNGVESLIPGYAFKMPPAAPLFSHALHGIEQAFVRIELLAPRMPHGAGAGLQHAGLHGVFIIVFARDSAIDGIIRLDGDDFAVLDAALDQACGVPATVVVACRVEIFDILVTLAELVNYRIS